MDNKRHPFKWLKYKGANVRIDRDIASLMTKLWKLGICTTNSCQEHCSFTCPHLYKTTNDQSVKTKYCYNYIWLCFESCEDVELFYNLIAEYAQWNDEKAMYHRMHCDRAVTMRNRTFVENHWAFMFVLNNDGVDGHWGRPTFNKKRSSQMMWIEDGCRKNDFVIRPQITFPRSDLLFVENKLDQALKQKRGK